MGEKRKVDISDDGRPLEEREGGEPEALDMEEELPDASTVESVGY
jgi:hypothetical protein